MSEFTDSFKREGNEIQNEGNITWEEVVVNIANHGEDGKYEYYPENDEEETICDESLLQDSTTVVTDSLSSMWLPHDVENLISLWEEHPCLYDVDSHDFKNSSVKQRIVGHMTHQLNKPALDIKRKMRILRTQFVREKNRQDGSKDHDAIYRYTSKWIYFNKLKFLEKSFGPKSTTSNEQVDDTANKSKMKICNPVTKINVTPDIFVSMVPTKSHSQTIPAAATSQSSNDPIEPPTKRMAVSSSVSHPTDESSKALESYRQLGQLKTLMALKQKTTMANIEDPDDIFAKHVANELRGIMSPQAKGYAKCRIQQILYEAAYCSPHAPNAPQSPTNSCMESPSQTSDATNSERSPRL